MLSSNFTKASAAIVFTTLLGACSSTAQRPADAPSVSGGTPKAAAAGPGTPGARTVKSRDGSYTGEIIGTPAPNSKFAELMIGMEPLEVQRILGRFPDEAHNYESGKRWIPFYFGNDARRTQMLFKGEGCLIFTAGGAFSSGGDLIQIQVDPSGACYVP